MIRLQRLFRSDYSGESVIITRTLKNQKWETTEQFFPFTHEIKSSRAAVVIGNGISRADFDLKFVLNHHGGFEGEQRLETYACNAAFRDFASDFLIVNSKTIADEIEFGLEIATEPSKTIFFANANIVVDHPTFHLIPQNPLLNAGALAAYLAAFNGHKKVFLLGFDGQDTPGINVNIYAGTTGYDPREAEVADVVWTNMMRIVFDTYYDTQFIRVMPSEDASYPESWKYCLNFKQIDFRGFVIAGNL